MMGRGNVGFVQLFACGNVMLAADSSDYFCISGCLHTIYFRLASPSIVDRPYRPLSPSLV